MQDPRGPTERFSDRVNDYVHYRPRYPADLVPLLQREIGLQPAWLIADIGSGTGFSAQPFLENGNRVIGVEPNAAMRAAAERLLANWPSFRSQVGTAEQTGLHAHSIDLIVAGQAFHWFDREKARAEFLRILRPAGWTVLLWNRRRTDSTPFLQDYEALLERYGTDYQEVRHDNLGAEEIARFFGQPAQLRVLPYTQTVDLAGLRGRLLSSSYTPGLSDPRRAPMLVDVSKLFQQYQQGGTVRFEYDTEIYYGQLRG